MTGQQTITTERVGRRTYIAGNTFAAKDTLRSAGAHWDGERRAWWIGSDAEAKALAERINGAAPKKR